MRDVDTRFYYLEDAACTIPIKISAINGEDDASLESAEGKQKGRKVPTPKESDSIHFCKSTIPSPCLDRPGLPNSSIGLQCSPRRGFLADLVSDSNFYRYSTYPWTSLGKRRPMPWLRSKIHLNAGSTPHTGSRAKGARIGGFRSCGPVRRVQRLFFRVALYLFGNHPKKAKVTLVAPPKWKTSNSLSFLFLLVISYCV